LRHKRKISHFREYTLILDVPSRQPTQFLPNNQNLRASTTCDIKNLSRKTMSQNKVNLFQRNTKWYDNKRKNDKEKDSTKT